MTSPKVFFAQPFTLPGSTVIGVVASAYGSANPSVAAGTYRTKLAPAGGIGTESSPFELLSAVQTAINALTFPIVPWIVSLTTDGYVKTAYTGPGTGSITWNASQTIKRQLGYTANLAGVTSAGIVAPEHPTHTVWGTGRDEDTSEWAVLAPRTLLRAGMDGRGRVHARPLVVAPMGRSVRAGFVPKDRTLYPPRTPLAGDPSRSGAYTDAPGPVLPWGWTDFVYSCAGKRCAFAIGTAQANLAGSALYDVGYLTYANDQVFGLENAETDIFFWVAVDLTRVGTETNV